MTYDVVPDFLHGLKASYSKVEGLGDPHVSDHSVRDHRYSHRAYVFPSRVWETDAVAVTIIEIGSLRERVELLEAPRGGPRPRTGRIRHANGENSEIDVVTLGRLVARARAAGSRQLVWTGTGPALPA